MGNCLRRDSAAVWAGDDDDSQLHGLNTTQPDHVKSAYNPEKQRLLGEIIRSSSASSTCTSGGYRSGSDQVKIKITKKELEKLVGGGNVQGLSSAEQLLAQLMMNGRDDHDLDHDPSPYYDDLDEMDHQRPWRPVLQSIPEVN